MSSVRASTVSRPLAWYAPTIAAVASLLQLPENWDEGGSLRIEPAIVQAAMTLLNSVMLGNTPAPSVVPTTRGGIQFEWHTRGIDLEVEFLSPAQIQGFFEDHQQNVSWEKDLSFNLQPLSDVIASLSER